MQFHDFNPKEDGTVIVNIPIEDMGNGESFLSVQFKEEHITIEVLEMDDQETLYSATYTYEDFCNFIEARDFQVMLLDQAKELFETKERHPASRNHLQLIDGGGKEDK